MAMEELNRQIAQLRSRPLLVVCRTPAGKERPMTLEERRRTESVFIHVAADDLDALLSAELGGK